MSFRAGAPKSAAQTAGGGDIWNWIRDFIIKAACVCVCVYMLENNSCSYTIPYVILISGRIGLVR